MFREVLSNLVCRDARLTTATQPGTTSQASQRTLEQLLGWLTLQAIAVRCSPSSSTSLKCLFIFALHDAQPRAGRVRMDIQSLVKAQAFVDGAKHRAIPVEAGQARR